MKIILINGYPESGKTTLINELSKEYKVKNISSIDYVKLFAIYKFGWNGEKTPKARKLLSDLKKILEEWDGSPTTALMEQLMDINMEDVSNKTDTTVFIDVREPDELDRLKALFIKQFGLRVYTWFVNRESVKNKTQSNSSDSDVENYEYDYTVENNGSLDELIRNGEFALTICN